VSHLSIILYRVPGTVSLILIIISSYCNIISLRKHSTRTRAPGSGTV
jgi:hypothetical protein